MPRSGESLGAEDLKLFRRPNKNGIDDTHENVVTPLEAEEEYFRELIDIYRRPDLLYERTGPSRHVSFCTPQLVLLIILFCFSTNIHNKNPALLHPS